MAKDPSEMTQEELEAELSMLSTVSDAAAHEHRVPPPNLGAPAYQAVLDDMTTAQKGRAMLGRGMNRVYTHGMNLIPGIEREPIWGQDVSDKGLLEREGEGGPDQALLSRPGGGALSLIGEGAALTPTMLGTTAALSRVPRIGKALFSTPMRRGITEGTLQGGLMAPPGHKAEGMIYGAGAGATLPLAANFGRKMVRGVEPTPWAQEALDRGVDLNVGQMNPDSTLGGIQRGWLSDLPIIGKRFRSGDVRAYDQWKKSAFQDVAAPGIIIAKKENLGEMLADAEQSFGPAYDQVKGFPTYPYILNTTGANKPLRIAFRDVVKAPGTYDNGTRKSVEKFLGETMSKLSGLKRQPVSNDFLEMRSGVRAEIRRLRKSNSVNAGDKADLLEMAEDRLTDVIESQLPPGALKNLKSIDLQYAKYKILEDAMWRANGNGAKLLPGHITAAVRAATSKGRFARGEGLMREYADSADELFSPVPHAAGADQAAASVLPALAAVAHPGATATVLAPLLGLTGTRVGRRMAAGMTAPQRGLQSLQDRVIGATQGQLAAKYGPPAGMFTRATTRQAITPGIKATSVTVPDQALGVAQTDLARLRDLWPGSGSE